MNMFYRHVSFDDVLSYGTIFFGTLFKTRQDIRQDINDKNKWNSEIFSVEDIFYYKGDDISYYTYHNKLNLIKNIFDTKLRYNMAFFNSGVVFGLPVMTTDFTEAYDKAMNLPYSVYSIQYKYFDDKSSSQPFTEFYHFNNNNNNNNSSVSTIRGSENQNQNQSQLSSSRVSSNTVYVNKYNDRPSTTTNEHIKQKPVSSDIYKVFFIKPDLQNDIYYLYQISTTNFDVISKEIAHIPDYKTSVLMNKLFRNIKENSNLDSLEESDEEEEFENIQIDKFVDLNKIIKMRCIFNYKFKKWVPVSVVS